MKITVSGPPGDVGAAVARIAREFEVTTEAFETNTEQDPNPCDRRAVRVHLEVAEAVTAMRTEDLYRLVSERAVCRSLEDPDVMFPDPVIRPAGVLAAQQVCARCPVRGACRELAERRGERHGVWGGVLFSDDAAEEVA